MPSAYVKDSGVQKRAKDIYIKDGGVQKRTKQIYIKVAGVQVLVYRHGFDLVIAADTTNYNIRTALLAAGWNGTDPIGWTLTVNSGIYVRATAANVFALQTGSALPAGSGPFLLTNLGFIQGKGGVGGAGATGSLAATNGANGGPAIKLEYPISIDNTAGKIYSGGGGGGGGGLGRV
jgi:hypothetical protein